LVSGSWPYLPDRKDGQRRVDHGDQSGHFYLAESGHFYLAVTLIVRIMYIMLNYKLCGHSCCWHPANNREAGFAFKLNGLHGSQSLLSLN
jgi:hypothetical protein